jgi:hypothetical protein
MTRIAGRRPILWVNRWSLKLCQLPRYVNTAPSATVTV